MIHEFGASSAQYDPERIAAFDRLTLYSGLAAGACGFLPWCYTDAAPELFRRAPYLLAPHETQFGLTTWDRQDRPRGRVLREFSRLLNAHLSRQAGGMELTKPNKAGQKPPIWAGTDSADYQAILKAIEEGKRALDAKPRIEMPGAVAVPQKRDFGRTY